MARAFKTRELAWPRIERKGELIGYFPTLDSGTLHAVRQLLHDRLSEKERARIERRDFYCRTYRLNFCGGSWQGYDADKVPNAIRGGVVTLEFWPDGVALRFSSFGAEPLTTVDDNEAA